MDSVVRKLGASAVCAAVVAGISLSAYGPANAAELRLERVKHHHVAHWRGRIFYPPTIGGFLLGAATYTYAGFPPAGYYYESCFFGCRVSPAAIVVRSRY